MTNSAAWHAANTAFLTGEVERVRRLLAIAADRQAGTVGRSAEVGPSVESARHYETDDTFVPALEGLTEALDMSAFERDTLLLCAAAALDARVAELCAAANGDRSKPYPTFALAMRLFDDPAWGALAPSASLRHWRLVEIHQAPSEPLVNGALRADERIINYVKGLNHIDDRVATWIRPVEPGAHALTVSQGAVRDRVLSRLLDGQPRGGSCVQLLGPAGAAKRALAASVSTEIGATLWQLPASALQDLAGDIETFSRLLLRESILTGAALYLDCDEDAGPGGHGQSPLLARFLDRLDGMLVFVASRDPVQGADRVAPAEFVGKPPASEQRSAWMRLLGASHEETANLLAGQFNLDLETIERIAARPRGGEGADAEERLWLDAREAVRPRVMGLAERIDARADWNDMVLPPQQASLLRELAAQVRNQWVVNEQWGFAGRASRGLGISAMFCGDSGTGKTMAAEVIARDARLDLYRIDLAAVVSKYIGETEKNLRRVFDAFEDGGAILFFDEADALFGKRSEVKDSHDRYANIEINYLLQRMEAFRGLVVLATNRRSALDHAFLRRLRFIVDFPYPGPAERQAIWQRVFPPEMPRDPLDPERLARLPLSGGNIQSVALNAAFRAAHERRPVNIDLIFASARAELVKLDIPINEADFQPPRDLRRIA